VSLGLLNELEHFGRAGWVREKICTLLTLGRRWPAPPPRRSCTARRGLHRLDGCPTPPDTGQAQAKGRGTAAAEGARAPAARRGHSQVKEESEISSHPPQQIHKGWWRRKSADKERTARRRARARGHRQAVRRPPTDRGGGDAPAAERGAGEWSGRGTRGGVPPSAARSMAAALRRLDSSAGCGPCRRRGGVEEIITRPVTRRIHIRVNTRAGIF